MIYNLAYIYKFELKTTQVMEYMKPRPLNGTPKKASSAAAFIKKSEQPFLNKDSLDWLDSRLAFQSYVHGQAHNMFSRIFPSTNFFSSK